VKIQLLSDLHLEVHPQWQPQPAPLADVLVLAGDVGSYQYGGQMAGADFGLERFSPCNGWPVPVLYVPGNHEYDALDFDATHVRLRSTCERLGITWLERECVVLNGVRFVGTTLWSDFDALAQLARPALQLKARDKAFRAANFYLRRTGGSRFGQPLMAQEVRDLALECQDWLRNALCTPHEGPTVAVTHFAPSLRSADPRYGAVPGTAGFCNGLDDLLPLADLWMHGHLHCPSDYVHRGCRVVANPLGYHGKGEQAYFQAQMCVEVVRSNTQSMLCGEDSGSESTT
jgi:predicted phosphodiesterase